MSGLVQIRRYILQVCGGQVGYINIMSERSQGLVFYDTAKVLTKGNGLGCEAFCGPKVYGTSGEACPHHAD